MFSTFDVKMVNVVENAECFCMSMKHMVEDLNDGTYIVMLCEVVELALIMRCHLAAWECLCFMSVCCSVSGFVTC